MWTSSSGVIERDMAATAASEMRISDRGVEKAQTGVSDAQGRLWCSSIDKALIGGCDAFLSCQCADSIPAKSRAPHSCRGAERKEKKKLGSGRCVQTSKVVNRRMMMIVPQHGHGSRRSFARDAGESAGPFRRGFDIYEVLCQALCPLPFLKAVVLC